MGGQLRARLSAVPLGGPGSTSPKSDPPLRMEDATYDALNIWSQMRFVSLGSCPTTNLLKWFSISQQAGGPPNPVAYPTVPSEAVSFTNKEPSTPIPHEVREARYCS